MNCDKIKKYFEPALYYELNEKEMQIFQQHLSECENCKTEFENLKETLELVNNRDREDNSVFLDNLWNKIEPKLESNPIYKETIWEKLASLFTFQQKMSYQAAGALAILVIGIIIGKFLLSVDSTDQPIYSTQNEVNKEQVMQARAERYLDRSKVLLLGLMNFNTETDEVETIDLSHQQKISNELISEAVDLKDNLKGSSNDQLRRLVSEVELILLQIANLEMENDFSGIELIQDGVDKRGIFLKINIQELREIDSSSEPDKESPTNKNEKKS